MASQTLQAESAQRHRAALDATNAFHERSIDAGALAGLLDLIAGNREQLSESKRLAISALADMAQALENELEAAGVKLSEAFGFDGESDLHLASEGGENV